MKQRFYSFLVCFSLLLSMTVNLSGCRENVLRVGFDPSFEPMSYQEEDGTCRGYFLDIMEEVAHRMGMEFEAVPIWWMELNWNITENKIDCFIDCENNRSLSDEYCWSKPLLQSANKILVLANAKYKDVNDFEEGEYNFLIRHSSESVIVSRFSALPARSNLITYRTLSSAIIQLDNKDGQGALLNKYVCDYILNKYSGKYRVLPTDLDPSTYAVGFKLGNVELQTKVNAALEEMEMDGTLEKISTQWFHRDITKDFLKHIEK